jgi:hypothetical protein
MKETISRVASRVDFECCGVYKERRIQRLSSTRSVEMILYENGDHSTNCDSLGDKGVCQFNREYLGETLCPFLHER